MALSGTQVAFKNIHDELLYGVVVDVIDCERAVVACSKNADDVDAIASYVANLNDDPLKDDSLKLAWVSLDKLMVFDD